MIFLQTITDPMTVNQCGNYYSDITVSLYVTRKLTLLFVQIPQKD